MKIKITADSTCDLSRELIEENNIEILPLYVVKDGVSYRDGVEINHYEKINRIMDIVAPDVNIKFEGFLTHAGHTYNARSREEILQIHRDNLRMLKNIKERYVNCYPQLKISLGDTPSCSLADRFGVADEIRPGNFVFYDVTQLKIGSCDWYNIAMAVKCPVVDINRSRNEAVIYGGGVHFSKDRIDRPHGKPLYGLIAENHNAYWGNIVPGVELVSLSQEHGIVRATDEFI